MYFKISLATKRDEELLVRHRVLMWDDILANREELVSLPGSEDRIREWIKQKLEQGKLIGFIAKTEDGQVAGSGCIWIREQPPLPFTRFVEAPYLLSMYTEKGFRRKGVAGIVAEAAIKWCRSHGYDRVSLDASEAGKPLYEKLGFRPGYSMRLQLCRE